MSIIDHVLACARGFAIYIGCVGIAVAQSAAPPATTESPQQLADKIQAEVAEIRGLAFKSHVRAENQSIEDFGQYVERELERSIPPTIAQHYGKIVRKLGLYRGPEIMDLQGLMKMVATSQAAAYYDPEEQAFFVLMQDLPGLLLGTFYSHELYHGLQDQYFDLRSYLTDRQRDRSLNDDELLARQAVVEGEATYMMTLWTMKSAIGSIPPRALLAELVRQQVQMDMDTLRSAMTQPDVAALLGDDIATAMDAADDIPAFIIETMVGAYIKGLGFVFDVHGRGWSEVEKLYTEYPPASTEQILHPEKWFARESPTTIEWPSFETSRLFADWELLEQNVLGEIQWRIVLTEHGLGAEAADIAAGWDGDRYAVLKHKRSDELLLLMHTSWDSEADAIEFANGYRRLLAVKYDGADHPTRLAQNGRDVLIVEGGSESSIDAFVDFAKTAKKIGASTVARQ